MPTTLVDWLRAQDDELLAAVLRLRPDLSVPPPADLTVLATRAAVRASVHRACDDLDRVALAVLEAMVLADADRTPVARSEIARLLGPDVPDDVLTAALSALRDRLLVWGPESELQLVPSARDVVPRHPGGLGRVAKGPAASPELPELLAAVDDEERRVLDALAAGPPVGRSRAGKEGPVARLVDKGLLLRIDDETVELPRQVGLALRGDRPMGNLDVTPPPLDEREQSVEVVDRTAGGAVLEVLRQIDLLIDFWGRTPPPVLRSGGLGVRELRRTAREMGVEESVAALLIEVAVGADLIAPTDSITPEWVPTTVVDEWALGGPEMRWAALAKAWLDLPRQPGLAGTKDDQGRPIGVLSDGVRRPTAPRDRRRVLAGLAELPPGTAPGSPEALARLLAWRAPRRGGRLRDDVVHWALSEATVLGIVAHDALSTPGRALLDGDARLIPAVRSVLPEPVDHVLLQADLTAVAPGPLATDLAHELELVAQVESSGGATVFRFTEDTIRRALDAGRTREELHELLATRSATPVPQGLTYLIDDVARRHGRLRAGTAASFLRSEDEILIAEVMNSPVAEDLELRRIAPTVAVSSLPLVEVMNGLKEAGFTPTAEDTGGVVLDLTERGRRTAPRRRPGDRAPRELGDEQIASLISRMRAGEALVGMRRAAEAYANGSTIDLLRHAAAERRRVWIGFVDGHGVAGERVLEPTSVGGGVVEGWDSVHGGVHRVPLHRITSISLVDESV
ncbi:Helicase conserved C-terminal domain-containing protein [Pseudonocardia thermophila]|jgi:hypothetical protein|uniref:Helicase conserved C-terminal domain-containing protein n=1 Tax=Pseudonocardia thermophila TaxID=1848 RepID=A0A1M6RTG4_PSETH|nr:helicase-associated domain-containing protein [Pseudonocardia thermophila]SHK35735.1 Helicase conserved C-terminal domain-containing protein [Pseudonocardia thermophila]